MYRITNLKIGWDIISTLLGLFIFLPIISSSQIVVITDNDIVKHETIIAQGLDQSPAPTIAPGTAGTGIIWDFKDLQKDEADTFFVVDPVTYPGYQQFPSSSFAYYTASENDSVWGFVENSPTELKVIGLSGIDELTGDTITVPFELQMLSFPSQLGAKFEHHYTISDSAAALGLDPDGPGPHPTVDSIKLKIARISISEIDAEGTLTTPFGTFEANRQFLSTIIADSAFMYTNGQWSLISNVFSTLLMIDPYSFDTNYSYTWWSNEGVGFPLVDMPYDLDNDMIDGSVLWIEDVPKINNGIIALNQTTLKLFPNPLNDLLTIEFEQAPPPNASLILYTITGAEVANFSMKSIRETIDLQYFEKGAYLYEIRSTKGAIQKGKLILQ